MSYLHHSLLMHAKARPCRRLNAFAAIPSPMKTSHGSNLPLVTLLGISLTTFPNGNNRCKCLPFPIRKCSHHNKQNFYVAVRVILCGIAPLQREIACSTGYQNTTVLALFSIALIQIASWVDYQCLRMAIFPSYSAYPDALAPTRLGLFYDMCPRAGRCAVGGICTLLT